MIGWRPPSADRHVLLYTRVGCHLCEEAHAVLEAAQQGSGFRLEVVDIDTDPDLVRQHGDSVPVVVIDGTVRFRGRVNPVLLTRLLRRW